MAKADYRIAGAYELPLQDASVDGDQADKVFHELAEPERALEEARRVLTLGGRIVLIGQDRDTFVTDSTGTADVLGGGDRTTMKRRPPARVRVVFRPNSPSRRGIRPEFLY